MDMKGFTKAAQSGVVTVEFNKIDTGELRIMPCTLNSELSGGNVPQVLEQREGESEHLAVWSMDKQAWRSFRISTVVQWYEGYPSDQT